jgi:hypothetical protein
LFLSTSRADLRLRQRKKQLLSARPWAQTCHRTGFSPAIFSIRTNFSHQVYSALVLSIADATLYGWGNRDRLAQSLQTYSLDSLILRTMAQNNISAGESTAFLGSPAKTIVCNNEIYILTCTHHFSTQIRLVADLANCPPRYLRAANGYVHRVGYDSDSVLSTGQIIRVLNYQIYDYEVDFVVDIACSSSNPTPVFAITSAPDLLAQFFCLKGLIWAFLL